MPRTTVIPPPDDPVRALTRWAAQYCPRGGTVLDVGAGEHASGGLAPLGRKGAVLVGTDPDPAIEHNTGLVERYLLPVEELGSEHDGRYDVVLSVFVLEHVEDPPAFAAACARVLKPGGSWFALTPNVRHYFGATARVSQRLGVQPRLLHLLAGHEDVHHHHRFPTHYRFNSARTVQRVCSEAGFASVDLRVYDAPDRYAWYLPAPVDRLPACWSAVVYRFDLASLMGHLSFRAQR